MTTKSMDKTLMITIFILINGVFKRRYTGIRAIELG